MGKFIDLTGQRFGRLVVLNRLPKGKHGDFVKWHCLCDCGNETNVASVQLIHGHTKSCGCLKNEKARQRCIDKTKFNTYELFDDYVVLYASNTLSSFVIDKEDFERVRKFTWMENERGYIVRTNSRQPLHQFILMVENSDYVVDHIDRNKKNNRKNNLRLVTQTENAMNRTINKNNEFGVSGVHKNKSSLYPYEASIGAKGRFFKQQYKTLEEAIIGRLKAEKELLGDNAPQKHLFERYGI